MNPMQQEPGPTIRITREEAFSPHVDDLLKRQMSLRGEKGVTRETRGRWYYRNWFIFMVVGLLAGLAGWAALEPLFDDFAYLQGKVEESDHVRPEDLKSPRARLVSSVIQVNGETVFLTPRTMVLKNGKATNRLGYDELPKGSEVGVYVEPVDLSDRLVGVARFVELNPPSPAPAKGHMSLIRQRARHAIAGLLWFAVAAGFIGLGIGAADGVVCRLPRRAFLAGFIGLIVGLIGGGISGLLANLIYAPITHLAMREASDTPGHLGFLSFAIQVGGRGLAWCMAGMAMGLGQGIALRSKRLALYGFLGGVIGGLFGGLLFDPIHFLLVGGLAPSAQWSRMIGMAVIGMSVGATIGIVELLSRDAWLRMIQGPLNGKEFVLFKDTMRIGASPKSDIYLFNDPAVTGHHATLRTVGDEAELECAKYPSSPVYVNGRPIHRTRLRDGDQIAIGNTRFIFEKRNG